MWTQVRQSLCKAPNNFMMMIKPQFNIIQDIYGNHAKDIYDNYDDCDNIKCKRQINSSFYTYTCSNNNKLTAG